MHVEIRPLELADAQISYHWRNNPVIWELTVAKPDREITLEMEQNWIRKVINNENERRFAIIVDEIYVGNTYLTDIDTERQEAQIHYFIGDVSQWGKGVATQAVQLVIQYAKQDLELRRIYAVVKRANTGSAMMLNKNGFSLAGDCDRDSLIYELHI